MAEPQFVSYSVDNDRKFRNAIKDAYDQVGNLTIPFKLIAMDFYRSEKAIFQLQGPGQYPDLGGLHPTEEKIRRAKAAKQRKFGFVYPLLKARGKLEAALTDPTDTNAINSIDSSGKSLTIGVSGSGIPYAIFHQSDRARKKLPQRKFLFIGPEATQFANSDQIGRLQRWLGIMNGFVVSKLSVIGNVKTNG